MRKYIIFIGVLLLHFSITAQNDQADDITTPELSPFSLDSSVSGFISNSVQEVTGKVNTSVPIATITARTISYPVALAYNGNNVFKQAQYLAQYKAQSILGIGWDMGVPKIVVDHKGTATREDDTFYLLANGSNTKLVCTNKVKLEIPVLGNSYKDFEAENFVPYKIRYKISRTDIVNSNIVTIIQDYWEITDDKGVTYIYGGTENARENIIVWGNWIGDSKNIAGASKHTTTWNLSKILDQWGNNLTFSYDKVEQGIATSGPKHTEASYLAEIRSSTGGKIVFTYDDKTNLEYYEPHTEESEPDAYQEQYEKKYLQSINTYNRIDDLVFTYDLTYDVVSKSASSDKNRYLKSITQQDLNNNQLPPQTFEYYTEGAFEGGIKKIIYPTGGSFTYNYDEKMVFDNANPQVVAETPLTAGYGTIAEFSGNDYALQLMREGDWNYNGRDDYRLKVVSQYWVGGKWKQNEFIFPELVLFDEYNNNHRVDNWKFISADEYYAFLIFNRDTDKGSLYLFHKEKNGVDWKRTDYRNITIESGDPDYKNEDPVLLSGDDFVAVGTNRPGRLLAYNWNGNGWDYKSIPQGTGQFYYGAANNFIIALNEDGGEDYVTGVVHDDRYYIHYLDAEKTWQTRSWSASIFNNFNYVAQTDQPSYLYASNNMAGFMADNNPEYILRWNRDYSLIAVDNVLGEYGDTDPLIPVGSNNFTLYNPNIGIPFGGTFAYPKKSASFDGSTWSVQSFSDNSGQGSGVDNFLTNRYVNGSNGHWLYSYRPNFHSWSSSQLTPGDPNSPTLGNLSIAGDLLLAGQYAYHKSNTGTTYPLGLVYEGVIGDHSFSNGNEIFIEYRGSISDPASSEYYHSFFLALNKRDNSLKIQSIANGNANSTIVLNNLNQDAALLGGVYPLLGKNILNTGSFKRIIDGEIGKSVKDKVVSSIEVDDNKGAVRKLTYTYNNPHPLPNDESTFYSEVVIENKGFGTGNNGKIRKYFNTGENDVQMAGLPTIVIVEDKNGTVKSKTETVWKKFIKSYQNPSYKTVGIGYYLRPEKQIETLFLNGQEVITQTDNFYNSLGMLSNASKTNSNGETEYTSIQYAFQNYGFVNDDNMLGFPYETRSVVGGKTVAVERSLWKQEGGKIYAYQNISGAEPATLRINNETTMVDTHGNVQESNNGLGVYKTVLYGYGDLYPVATISNARYTDVINALDVSYYNLQSLSSNSLEPELHKLYGRLPDAMINITLYDDMGRVVRTLDEREEAVNFVYDTFGRMKYTTDADDKVLEKREYHFGI